MNKLLFLILIFLSSSFVNQDQNPDIEALNEYLRQNQNHNISIGIITPETERILLYEAAGTKVKTTPGSVYEIGSITKTFTSTLLALQQINGSISIDDTLAKFLPANLQNSVTQRITLKGLATHSSGLPRLPSNFWQNVADDQNPYYSYSETNLYQYLEDCSSCTPPGYYSYSNLGAGVLGNILCHQEKTNYNEIMSSNICNPLGMSHTEIGNSKVNMLDGFDKNIQVKHWDFTEANAGQGAARSTIEDMMAYLRFNINPDTTLLGKAISLTQKEHFRDPANGQRMGLGWHMGYFNHYNYYEHTGGTGGFRSFIGFIPETGIGVVILSNSTSDVSLIGIELLKKYMSHKV